MQVLKIDKKAAHPMLLNNHYAKRVPSISHAFGIFDDGVLIGVCTFGTPGSRHMQIGACKSNPGIVTELNRLWVDDAAPRNTESFFIARCLALLPGGLIVVSYADTMQGHYGFVYRAANFKYAGWTDMDRKTPRFDYVVPGKHSRDAFRNGEVNFTEKVRRQPKIKYWAVTGSRSQKKAAEKICCLPSYSWADLPPPSTKNPLIDAPD